MINNTACLIGVAGRSNSGKTTLIECALPELKRNGFAVGVLKHVSHSKLRPDAEGKDTDRFYQSGADFVYAHDSVQAFARYHSGSGDYNQALSRFPNELDIIIIEGHKTVEIPGIWLAPDSTEPPETNRRVLYRNDEEYKDKFLQLIYSEMDRHQGGRTINAGLLIGGKSTRMGSPKTLLRLHGEPIALNNYSVLSQIASTTLLLGKSELPPELIHTERLPDAQGVNGPLAGMLSAFRWAPAHTWVILAVDMPLMTREALEWLMKQRKPGVWAVLPKISEDGPAEATGACYEPMIFGYIESLAAKGISTLQEISRHPKVITPLIPKQLAAAWANINTRDDLEKITAD